MGGKRMRVCILPTAQHEVTANDPKRPYNGEVQRRADSKAG